jgi:hypothetical protein
LGGRCGNWFRNGCGERFRDRRGIEFCDAVGEQGSIADPVVDAVALEGDRGGCGARVVGANDFDGAAVAGSILLYDNDAVVGLLGGANARQTDHQHLGNPLKKSDVFGRRDEIERSTVEGRD